MYGNMKKNQVRTTMMNLGDDLLEIIGSFVPSQTEEVCAFVYTPPDNAHGVFLPEMFKLPSLQIRPAYHVHKIPSLDIRDCEFACKTYMDLTQNKDGSQSFFDAFGNHFTVFTWFSGDGGFARVWCNLEEKFTTIMTSLSKGGKKTCPTT